MFNLIHELYRSSFLFFKAFILLFIFRERGKERERNIDQLPLVGAPTGDHTHNPGIRPDLESNLNQPYIALWDNTQPTEPHWSGHRSAF